MRPLNDYFLTVEVPTVETASSGLVVAPDPGTLIKAFIVSDATTDGTPEITLKIDAQTDITETITMTAAAAGTVATSEVLADYNSVGAGSVIKATTDGDGTTGGLGRVTLVIRR